MNLAGTGGNLLTVEVPKKVFEHFYDILKRRKFIHFWKYIHLHGLLNNWNIVFNNALVTLALMCSHGGGHGGGGPCSASVVNFDYGSEGMNYNLNAFINKDKVTVLNEEIPDSGVHVLKLWSDRADRFEAFFQYFA